MSDRQNADIEIKNAVNDTQTQLSNLTKMLYDRLMQKDQLIQNMRIEIEKLKNPPKEKK